MKVCTIVGARPQFIRAVAVSRALAESGIDEVFVHTGQHFDSDMSDAFFEQMHIPRPKYQLGIGGGSHGAHKQFYGAGDTAGRTAHALREWRP